jgi:hypothetical protein
LQFHIKSVVNTRYPLASSNRFVLTEQETLLRQHEAITKTARETLHKILQQLDSMDFRPLASAADYAMKTIMANVDNDKLSDADFRDFIRTFSAGKPHETGLADECVTETAFNQGAPDEHYHHRQRRQAVRRVRRLPVRQPGCRCAGPLHPVRLAVRPERLHHHS